MIADKVDLSKYIELRNDRPYIRGRRIPILFLISFQKSNHASVERLCDEYALSEAEVLSALLYYSEHKEELDRLDALDIQAEQDLFEQYAHDHKK